MDDLARRWIDRVVDAIPDHLEGGHVTEDEGRVRKR